MRPLLVVVIFSLTVFSLASFAFFVLALLMPSIVIAALSILAFVVFILPVERRANILVLSGLQRVDLVVCFLKGLVSLLELGLIGVDDL